MAPAHADNGDAALPDDPGEVFADSVCRGTHFRTAVRAKVGTPQVILTTIWGRTEQ